VRLDVGDAAGEPAPEGYVIPSRRDARVHGPRPAAEHARRRHAYASGDRRERVGTAFAGRKLDFRTFVHDVAPALESGHAVLGELAQDDKVLGTLVDNSDRVVASLAGSHAQISRAIDLLAARPKPSRRAAVSCARPCAARPRR